MKIGLGLWVLMTAALVAEMPCAWAQDGVPIQGVYTCVDAKGRKLTSDRPIADCVDREQKVLNPSGTVRAKVGPTLTGPERAELEAKAKREALEQERIGDEKRRNRALLARYPNIVSHNRERTEALLQVDQVIKTAKLRQVELQEQRKAIDIEMEFYKKDPSKAPAHLRRRVDENTQAQAAQKQFLDDQDAQIRRINIQFDEELQRLGPLWMLAAGDAVPSKRPK